MPCSGSREASSFSRWEKKCRDREPDIIQTVRNLVTVIPKWDESIKFLWSGLKEQCEKGGSKSKRARGNGRLVENDAL